MAEAEQIVFTYKEVVEALLEKHGIDKGLWALLVKFGINAANIGTSEIDLQPTAIIPILAIGLQKTEKETNMSVDAAKVRTKPRRPGKRKK